MDSANEEKAAAKAAKQQIQDNAATAKKSADKAEAVADTTKLNKESAEEVKKGEAEIEVAKETKAKKVKAQKPAAADLVKPWGTTGEVWTANMPEHNLEGYAQKGRKDVKENELVQNKNEESDDESSDEEEE